MRAYYDDDIRQAALSAPAFDAVNIEAIAEYHGEDPATVARDIQAYRNNV